MLTRGAEDEMTVHTVRQCMHVRIHIMSPHGVLSCDIVAVACREIMSPLTGDRSVRPQRASVRAVCCSPQSPLPSQSVEESGSVR